MRSNLKKQIGIREHDIIFCIEWYKKWHHVPGLPNTVYPFLSSFLLIGSFLILTFVALNTALARAGATVG